MKNQKIKKEGFIALGYQNDVNFIWSNYRNCLFALNDKDFNKNKLINLLGSTYVNKICLVELENKNKKEDKKIIFDITKIIDLICNQCLNAGLFRQDKELGAGVFKDPIDKNELIINTENIWGTRKDYHNERVVDKVIFANKRNLFIKKDDKEITQEEINILKNEFKSWNFKRKDQDINLLFGWLSSNFLCGTLKWRTHASITGSRGTGKSTLLEFIKNLLGANCFKIDGDSSAAGIRQNVGSSSCVVLIDESESDANKLTSTLNMLRSCNDGEGSNVWRGTQNQTGLNFEIKISGLLCGIVPPVFNGADASRFLRINLDVLSESTIKSDLLNNKKEIKELGNKLWIYMVNNYSKFRKICKYTRSYLINNKNDSRFADTFTTIIAASFLLDNISIKIEDIKEKDVFKYVSKFDLQDEKDNKYNSNDEKELLNLILTKEIKDDQLNTKTIIEYIKDYYFEDNKDKKELEIKRKLIRDLLSRYSIKTKMEKEEGENEEEIIYFYLKTSENKIRKEILKGTRFENGDIKSVLTRIEGSEIIKDGIYIGNIRSGRNEVIKIKLDSKNYNIYNEKQKKKDEKEELIKIENDKLEELKKEIDEILK